jgi:hypothetical protein
VGRGPGRTRPMVSLEDVAAELYALPPDEFTPTRNARSKELKADGDRDLAAAVGGLPKPSAAAWAVNLLVRAHSDEVGQLLTLGTLLRDAQAALAGDELRTLNRQQHQVMAAVVRRAAGLTAEHGHRLSDPVSRQVESTLRSAMSDPAAADAVLSGVLVRALESSGWEPVDLTGAIALADAPVIADVPRSPARLKAVPDPPARRSASRKSDDGTSEPGKRDGKKAELKEAGRDKAGRDEVDRDSADRDKAERDKAERDKAERERADREQAERERAEREQAERERAERERRRREAQQALADAERDEALTRAQAETAETEAATARRRAEETEAASRDLAEQLEELTRRVKELSREAADAAATADEASSAHEAAQQAAIDAAGKAAAARAALEDL